MSFNLGLASLIPSRSSVNRVCRIKSHQVVLKSPDNHLAKSHRKLWDFHILRSRQCEPSLTWSRVEPSREFVADLNKAVSNPYATQPGRLREIGKNCTVQISLCIYRSLSALHKAVIAGKDASTKLLT